MQKVCRLALVLVLLAVSSVAWAEARQENHFATITVDGKKVGQVHYTVSYGDSGEIENLKTRASLSILGINLFSFSQDHQEDWGGGELRKMSGRTDDDGTIYNVTLERNATEYGATLNGKSLTLPHNAFPISLWHYNITQADLLFDLIDLQLMKVQITKSEDTLKIGKQSIAAERYDITGELDGALWYSPDKEFLQAQFSKDKYDVTITIDP